MIWLLLSILFSAGLFMIFKSFGKYHIHIFPAIVINYFTCFIIGNLWPDKPFTFSSEVLNSEWLLPAAGMGFLFVMGFYSMGMGTKKAGASGASVASKMSVIIPALFAVILYNEKLKFFQMSGILLSLISVFLMSEPTVERKRINKSLGLLFVVFLTSGMVDTGLNMLSHKYSGSADSVTLSTVIFGAAAVIGGTIILMTGDYKKIRKKELNGGIILGVINFLSLIAVLNGIDYFNTQTAWFFAVNNIGIVMLSSISAALFFRERIHASGYIGLLLAFISIVLMNVHAFF